MQQAAIMVNVKELPKAIASTLNTLFCKVCGTDHHCMCDAKFLSELDDKGGKR